MARRSRWRVIRFNRAEHERRQRLDLAADLARIAADTNVPDDIRQDAITVLTWLGRLKP